MSDPVKLAPFTSDFLSDLTNNVQQNGNAVIEAVNQQYQALDSVFNFGTPKIAAIDVSKSKELNRTTYLWLNQVMSQLERAINGLIRTYNAFNITGPPDYLLLDKVKLQQFKLLSFANYRSNVNQNWQLLESTLNKCQTYLQPYLNFAKGV
ncbi:hypothetical protein [Loigolactobacillus rennini]|uniref:Uncharacterized protein n=1 Tax=Loigolactobacillus rennini DSM 20253 TaxID=1423796 RepID=A0A0R2CNB5_9LACO|nr:hypothetical protein [Loigolactobacillus rennini]KRM92789.1 hypothetical protein FC24_GL000958 [Loigolactobacillus rennini DSM 20253]